MSQVHTILSAANARHSRYAGTRAYDDNDEDRTLFFGRDAAGEQLLLRILSVPFLVQYGKSGLGKTSLLQAWLFPRLRREGGEKNAPPMPYLPLMIRLNDANESLTDIVRRSIQKACESENLDYTPGETTGLWELLATTVVWRDDLLLTPVLVFDQFEEVFTLRDGAFRQELAEDLGALTTGIAPERIRTADEILPDSYAAKPNVKIVISIREDYLGLLEEFSAAIPNLFHERLRLEPLTEEEAQQAIVGPGRLESRADTPFSSPKFEFDEALLKSMIYFLKGRFWKIEPFQLQLLSRFAEKIATHKAGPQMNAVGLSLEDFQSTKSFDSVLTDFYKDTIQLLEKNQREKARDLCQEGLLDASGHRLPLEESQIFSKFGVTKKTLKVLSYERILRREARLDSIFYEITHDRLADSILKCKRDRLPKRVRKNIRILLVSVFAALVLLVYWNNAIRQERDSAYKQRQKAENMLGFLLGDFLEEIKETGRSSLLTQIDQHVSGKEQKANTPVKDMSALNTGLELRNRGDIKRILGTITEAEKNYIQALDVFESQTGGFIYPREAARTHQRLGQVFVDKGKVTPALKHFQAEEKAWRESIKAASENGIIDACINLAKSLINKASLNNEMGEPSQALSALSDSVNIILDLFFGDLSSESKCGLVAKSASPFPDAKALGVLSEVTVLRASILAFKEDSEALVQFAKKASERRPELISLKKNISIALTWRGNNFLQSDPNAALLDYENATRQFSDELRRRDPSNRLWLREHAASQLLVSEGVLACLRLPPDSANACKPLPRFEKAEVFNLEAMGTLRGLAQYDPDNLSLQTDLAWALEVRARILEKQGQADNALLAYQQAEKIYQNPQWDPTNVDTIERLGWLKAKIAKSISTQRQWQKAIDVAQESIDIFKQLSQEHGDNPEYLWGMQYGYHTQAELLTKLNKNEDAKAAAALAKAAKDSDLALQEKLSPNKTSNKKNDLFIEQLNKGRALYEKGSYAEALDQFKTSEVAIREAIVLRPTHYILYNNLRLLYQLMVKTNNRLNITTTKEINLTKAMRAAYIANVLVAGQNKNTEEKRELYLAMNDLIQFLYELYNENQDPALRERTLEVIQEDILIAEQIVKQDGPNNNNLYNLGVARDWLGFIQYQQPVIDGWEEITRSSIVYYHLASKLDPTNYKYSEAIGDLRNDLSRLLMERGDKEKAFIEYRLSNKAYQDALKLSEQALELQPDSQEIKDRIQKLKGYIQ